MIFAFFMIELLIVGMIGFVRIFSEFFKYVPAWFCIAGRGLISLKLLALTGLCFERFGSLVE